MARRRADRPYPRKPPATPKPIRKEAAPQAANATTVESILAELDGAYRKAEAADNPGAMISAAMAKAKLLGLIAKTPLIAPVELAPDLARFWSGAALPDRNGGGELTDCQGAF